jgi:peptide deformylase
MGLISRGMAILPILKLPNPALREKSAPWETVNAETRKLAGDMLETMYAAPGIGLAGSQVGILKRIVVIDTARNEEPKNPKILINPEIVFSGDERRSHEEGCLSIPEIYAEVERSGRVQVRYVDEKGRLQEEEFRDLLATVIQHEIDHLNGILFIDHLSRLKRDLIVKKFLKAQREKDAVV